LVVDFVNHFDSFTELTQKFLLFHGFDQIQVLVIALALNALLYLRKLRALLLLQLPILRFEFIEGWDLARAKGRSTRICEDKKDQTN